VPGLAELAPLTNENIFDLRSQPARLAVLGAGPLGCELAQAFARLGTAVTLIEAQPRLLPGEEPEASARVAAALERDGVRLHLGAKVLSAAPGPNAKLLELEGGARIEADEILAAVGRARNLEGLALERAGVRFDARSGIVVDAHLRTSHRDIFAAGDVCSRDQFTHSADAQARIVVRNALFRGRARADRLLIPRCTYTQPEVARAGATRAELAQAGTAFAAFRVGFGELDRGRTDGGDDGYAELLIGAGGDRILGATIVGRDAGEQLAPIAVLMSTGKGLRALGSLVLPYPTRSEYLRRLADAWNRTRLTPRAASTLRWWLEHTR
jgi:pyruvate/2-oxoglutarate dehydrogenase complex dihydrolipoamide dehydrogenase (E3) component